MQTSDRTGIVCDHCGTQYKNDFTYYSWDFRPVSVMNSIRPALNQIFHTQTVFSLDICTSCFDKFKKGIIHNYGQSMDKKGAFTVCELSGNKFTGTYNYYHVAVASVSVRMTGQPNICTKCQHKTFDNDKVCSKCQGTDFIRPAVIDQQDRFVELNMCEGAMDMLREKAEQMRKVAGQWATTS